MRHELNFKFKGAEAEQKSLLVDYVINILEGIRDIRYLILAQNDDSTSRNTQIT